MTISYVLHENHLTSDPDDYLAKVHVAGTVDLEGIIERMIERGSTTTKADILAVLEDYHASIESLVLEGFGITTPGANYGASIRGVFNGPADSFEASRHTVEPTVNPGAQLRQAIRSRAQVQKGETVILRPNPVSYTDFGSGESNSLLTPGGMGKIVGHRLKFDATDSNQGIFFVAADGTATRVSMVGQNKPAELIFIVPDSLAAGSYTLEVRANFATDDLRSGSLITPLTVSAPPSP